MAFKVRNQVVSLSDEAKELLVRTTQLSTEHAKAKAERQAKEKRLASIQEQIQAQRVNMLPSITRTASALTDSLRRKLIIEQMEYANFLAKGFAKDHPQMKKLEIEMERTKAQLSAEVLRLAKGESLLDPVSQLTDLANQVLALEIDIQTDSTREASLRKVLEAYEDQIERLPLKELQLVRLTRSQEVNDNIYRLLLTKFEEARIAEASKIGNVRILDLARLPKSPVKPRKLLNLLISLIIGCIGGTVLATFFDSLDKTLKSPEEVEETLGLPLIGIIPEILTDGQTRGKKTEKEDEASEISRRLVTQYVPHSSVAETYRTLRTNLSYVDLDKPLKAIVVTSSATKEGKSTTVANLAITMAQMGVETLLIDTDLRLPILDKLFGMNNSPGLTDILLGKVTLEAAVQKTQVDHLSLLVAGPIPPNPSEHLASQKMGELVAQAKERYGAVLFDTPSIVAVTDSAVLSRWTDAVLLVVRLGRTDLRMALRAKELLENVKARLVGTVVNYVKPKMGRYYYYYYHYYGGRILKIKKEKASS